MRRATRRLHHIANALILAKLAVALTDQQLYAKALGQFLPVYTELEALLRRHKDSEALEAVASLAHAMPSRAEAMVKDLEHLLGPGWRGAVPPSSSAESYAERLRQLSERDPALLLPYAWSLHVPILLGFFGQRVARGLGIKEGAAGLAFFDVPDKKARLEGLRAAVNAAGRVLPPETREACILEAAEQFRRNNSVVAEFRLPLGSAAAAVGCALVALRAWLAAVLLVIVAVLAARRHQQAALSAT